MAACVRTCVRACVTMGACAGVCVCACAVRVHMCCVYIVRVLCASCSCMRVRVVRALCVSACARVRADGGACLRLSLRLLPSELEGRATARMLGAHLSARAGTVGRRGCGRQCCLLLGQCWVGRLWLGRERPATRWGDSSSEPSRGWHATHKGSSGFGDQPLARRPSCGTRCRPCTQSLPQTRTPFRPRLAARMHQWSDGEGRASGNQRVRASKSRRTVG